MRKGPTGTFSSLLKSFHSPFQALSCWVERVLFTTYSLWGLLSVRGINVIIHFVCLMDKNKGQCE